MVSLEACLRLEIQKLPITIPFAVVLTYTLCITQTTNLNRIPPFKLLSSHTELDALLNFIRLKIKQLFVSLLSSGQAVEPVCVKSNHLIDPLPKMLKS